MFETQELSHHSPTFADKARAYRSGTLFNVGSFVLSPMLDYVEKISATNGLPYFVRGFLTAKKLYKIDHCSKKKKVFEENCDGFG